MRKWTSVLLLILACLTLFGCGKSDEPGVTPSEEPQITEEPTPEPEPVYVLIGTVYDVDTFLNIRSGPGTSYDVIGRAYANEKFTVITEYYTEEWHQVEYDGGIAYLHVDYLIVQEVVAQDTDDTNNYSDGADQSDDDEDESSDNQSGDI